MPKIERVNPIIRTQELAEGLASGIAGKGWTALRAAQESGVDYSSMRVLLHPNYRKGKVVSKELCAKVIEQLVEDDGQRIRLLRSAGIETFILRGSNGFPDQIVQLL